MDDNADRSTSALIDLDTLLDSFMGERAIVANILDAFVDSFSDFEAVFLKARSESDKEAMVRHAHSLKGSAANIRAVSTSAKAAELQYALEGGEADSVIDQKLQAIMSELPKLVQFIQSFER